LDKLPEAASLERALLSALNQRRVLIVLDNAETLVEAVEREEPAALDLAAFLRERLPGTLASLLVTSRASLGWIGEHSLELGGLTPAEGAALFRQSAPQRQADIQMAEAEGLSVRLDGHPLALRLLGLTFNTLAVSLAAFLAEHEAHLRTAHDKYKTADHRHRTLFASIETSVRHLGDDARRLLSGLWLFHAPFLPETAAEIFAPLDLALANPGTPPDETAIANRKSKIENRKSKISSSFSTSAACCNTSAAASRWPAGALPPAADHAPVRGAPPGPGV
jgi:predicted ATPase